MEERENLKLSLDPDPGLHFTTLTVGGSTDRATRCPKSINLYGLEHFSLKHRLCRLTIGYPKAYVVL